MKKKILTFLLGGVFGLILAVPVFAASSTFYDHAKAYYALNCAKPSLTPNVAVICYLYDKVSEIDSNLASLSSRVSNLESSSASQSAAITDLKQRVSNLERPSPTPTPSPTPSPTPNNVIDLSSLLPLRPWDIAMSGSDYIVTTVNLDNNTGRLIRVTPSGNISSIASFDKRIFGITMDGSDFIISDGNSNLLRVTNAGAVTTIASGVLGNNYASDIAKYGSDYIVTDYPGGQLLRITPGGVTTTIASGLRNANGVIVDGTDFIVAANGITPTGTGKSTLYRVTQEGSVSVIAELSGYSSFGVTKMGSYYYVNFNNSLSRITTDGTISFVNPLSGGQIISITNNGLDIIATDYSNARLLKITP